MREDPGARQFAAVRLWGTTPLGGCVAATADRQGVGVAGVNASDLLWSEFRTIALTTSITLPLSRSEEEVIIARAIAEHEMRDQ